MDEHLTEDNWLLYAAKHYYNPQCQSTEEFIEDCKHVKYIKKLLTRYIEKKDLKERLILNHLMILYNLFGAKHVVRILYLKLKAQFHCLKPFLVLLNILPDKLYNIQDEHIVDMDLISMDTHIINELRKIKNGG